MSGHEAHGAEHHEHGIDCCEPGPVHVTSRPSVWKLLSLRQWITLGISGGLLIILWPFNRIVFGGEMPDLLALGLHLIAYFPVAVPVWVSAYRSIRKGYVFNEFILMGLATVGAFYVGEYAEGVAVMLFYTIGEWVQAAAVMRSRQSIRDLINSRPDRVHRMRNDGTEDVAPEDVDVGERLLFKVGERVSFDGHLSTTENRALDTASLTGESLPRIIAPGEQVLAGMVPVSRDVEIVVSRPLSESTLSRMLYLVEEAATRKAPSEKMIRKLASYYTPIVFFAAVLICLGPALIVDDYHFQTWLYRSLIFLVISCPCALVISIPLGFFGGLGAASRRGILVKGAQYLDALGKKVQFYFDKTGTLTTGRLTVNSSEIRPGFSEKILEMAAALESGIDHPLAIPIATQFPDAKKKYKVSHRQQFSGMGVEGLVDQQRMILGNLRFLRQKGIDIPEDPEGSDAPGQVHMALDGWYAGKIILDDEIKPEAVSAIRSLRSLGDPYIAILSGDTEAHVESCAGTLEIRDFQSGLLPEEKLEHVLKAKKETGIPVVFVGEGFNDAPVLAGADIGIAMGQLGADASIESADVVIQSDDLSRIPTAVRISRATQRVIWQNIALALGLKALVLTLGVFGMATLWQAVFADVGVALLAIANAVRLQRMDFL